MIEWVEQYLDCMDDAPSLQFMRAKAVIDALGQQEVIDALPEDDEWVAPFITTRNAFIEAYEKIEARMKVLGIEPNAAGRGVTHTMLSRFDKIREWARG